MSIQFFSQFLFLIHLLNNICLTIGRALSARLGLFEYIYKFLKIVNIFLNWQVALCSFKYTYLWDTNFIFISPVNSKKIIISIFFSLMFAVGLLINYSGKKVALFLNWYEFVFRFADVVVKTQMKKHYFL